MPKTKTNYPNKLAIKCSKELDEILNRILASDFINFTYKEKPNKTQLVRAALYVYIKGYHPSQILDPKDFSNDPLVNTLKVPEFKEHLKLTRQILW